ncbi:MAG: NmrA family protein [Rhizobacter sp.]|nr:NmrA family protein [Rhizobacter sp.]
MIVVTGATGQLGQLVLQSLLETVPAGQIVAAVRNPAKAADLAAKGVVVKHADYSQPATLEAAFAGADKLLLISSNELGQRAVQHKAVIDAAVKAKVGLVAYTSVLHADASPLGLAQEHRETEAYLEASSLPWVLLRTGGYTENDPASVPAALAHGAVMGSARDGRISSASRADYAAAAAKVLTSGEHAGKTYELAGDASYTLSEFAAEIAKQSGKTVVYKDLPEADYKQALIGFGLPEPVAALLSDSDVGVSKGALLDDSHQLSALIGRPTTPMATTVAEAVKA